MEEQDARRAGWAAPFDDSFESGSLDSNWTTAVSGEGQVTVVGGATQDGAFQLSLADGAGGAASISAAIVHVDLTTATDPFLKFSVRRDAGEVLELLPATFAGATEGDGVAISVDGGESWHRLWSAAASTEYETVVLRLGERMAELGIVGVVDTQIRFQQYGDHDNDDGLYYDTIQVDRAPTIDLLLEAGWNLISLPYEPLDDDAETFFAGVMLGRVWGMDAAGRVSIVSSLSAGSAYWVYSRDGGAVEQPGVPLAYRRISVSIGFHLIGSALSDTTVDVTQTALASQPKWQWETADRRWQTVDELVPGRGYLIRADELTTYDFTQPVQRSVPASRSIIRDGNVLADLFSSATWADIGADQCDCETDEELAFWQND